jgi:hypothetical protein
MFQGPTTVVKEKIAGTLETKDFTDYKTARHAAGITAETKVNQKSEPYLSAYKLLAKEYNASVDIIAELNSTRSNFSDAKSNMTRYGLISSLEAVNNTLKEKLTALKAAKTVGELDEALLGDYDAVQPDGSTKKANFRKGLSGFPKALLDPQFEFLKGKPAHKMIDDNVSIYQSKESKALVNDTAPVGPAVAAAAAGAAAAAAPAADPAGGAATGAGAAGASATPKVPARPAVPTFNLAGDMNADYVKSVLSLTSPELKLPEPAPAPKEGEAAKAPRVPTPEEKIAIRKRTEAVNSNIDHESFFLTTVIDKMKESGKDLDPQVKAIDDLKKGFRTVLTELHSKYSALEEGASLAKKEALSLEFRTRLAAYGNAADRFKNAATPELALAIGVIRDSHRAFVEEGEKLPPKKEIPGEATKFTEFADDPAFNMSQYWMQNHGFAKVITRRVKGEVVMGPDGEPAGVMKSTPSKGQVVEFLKEVKGELALLSKLPKDRYPEYQNFLKGGSKGLNFILTGANKFGWENRFKVYDQIDDDNDLGAAKRKIKYFEEAYLKKRAPGETGDRQVKDNVSEAQLKTMYDELAFALITGYKNTVYRDFYKGKPNPAAGVPFQGGYGPGFLR